MLHVDERGFNKERFWGAHTIKPLDFNYDFEPNFIGQNIWTLTDGLFLSNRQRLSSGSASEEALRVTYSRAQEAKKKNSALYRHFPRIDENVHQKSSQSGRNSIKLKTSNSLTGKYSRDSRVLSSGGSLSTSVTTPLGVNGTTGATAVDRKSLNSMTKNSKDLSSKKKKTSQEAGITRKITPQKATDEKGVPVKLSLEETERLLKSLDFRVRTRKKVAVRERSKSERVPKSHFAPTKTSQPATKMPFQKRGFAASPSKRERSTAKRKDKSPGKREKIIPRTSQNQLVRSSRKTSWQTSSSDSSKKMSTSTSGLDDLLGPLPRVKWTPEMRRSKERSASKKSPEKSSVTLMKASKMKAALKKVADRETQESQDTSEVEGSSREAVAVRKVRTTPMKIIPKVTINNQLLKSTTNKNEKIQEKKTLQKTALSSKKKVSASVSSTTSTLWTPENIALLDQITSDQQLKAVLMSAGDTYMKSRRYMSFKMNAPPVKIPVRMAAQKKKEAQTEAQNPTKTAETAKTPGKSDKEVEEGAVVVQEQPGELTQTGDGSDEKGKKAVKKPASKLKNEFGVKAAKATVVFKGKTSKMTAKTGAGAHLACSKKDVNDSPKRRPKFVTTTTKAKERLAQLTSEASGPLRVQSEKMAQIRRSNLDTLKKILDKSLSASNKPAQARMEESTKAQEV